MVYQFNVEHYAISGNFEKQQFVQFLRHSLDVPLNQCAFSTKQINVRNTQ